MFGGTTPTTLTTWYHSPQGGDAFSATFAGQFGGAVPFACTINLIQLNLTCANSCGTTDTVTATIVKNGVDQAMTCSTTSAAANTTVKTTCTANPVALAAGDDVAVKQTHTNVSPAVHYGVGLRCQ